MRTHHEVLILGGGTAGVTVASRLAQRIGSQRLAILEPSSTHYYQPLWTLVGGGLFAREESARDEATLIPDGVTWIREPAQGIDPVARHVVTASGAAIGYDYLVIATGVVVHWHAIPGLAESVGRPGTGVVSNYSYDTVASTWEAIRAFRGGTAVFTEPLTPVKCGGAPQKIMYLAEEAFRAHGVRGRSRVVFMNAKPTLFTSPYYVPALERVIKSRGIEVQLGQELVAVEPELKEATFRDVATHVSQVVHYAMLHVTPPMRPPEFLHSALLTNADGYVDVDKHTLQHVQYPEIFAIGDCTNLPTSKTGAAVRKQAPVLVENLLAFQAGEPLRAAYDGYTSCPVITGRGKLIMAEFDYTKHPVETFPVDQREERFSMYAVKAYMLPRLYWHGMLRGRV